MNRYIQLSLFSLVAAVALVLGPVGGVSATGGALPTPQTPARSPENSAVCPDASIREIHLPKDVSVDQILIEVAPGSALGHKTDTRVEVRAGRFSRVAHVMGDSGLKFWPALRGNSFEVTLDPVFAASQGACITRVSLIKDGREVVSVRP